MEHAVEMGLGGLMGLLILAIIGLGWEASSPGCSASGRD
jgi:hypothetical protein